MGKALPGARTSARLRARRRHARRCDRRHRQPAPRARWSTTSCAVDVDADGPFIELGVEGGINVEWIAPTPARPTASTSGSGSGAPATPWPAAPAPAPPPTRRTPGGWSASGSRWHMAGGDVEVAAGRHDHADRSGHPHRRQIEVELGRVATPWTPSTAPRRFGEYGGESGGFIERTFRERIVLVGVTVPAGAPRRTPSAGLDELDAAGRHRRRRRGRPRRAAPPDARPRHLRRQGQGRRDPRPGRGGRLRHRRVRRRAQPGPAAQPREAARPHRHRPHRGDPRHLRPERLAARRARPRSSWPSSATGCPGCGAGAASLSQQAGGIGRPPRRPGETQLEVDRRRIVRRIHKLEAELRDVRRHRERPAQVPRRAPASPEVAIVGYTNAGKSTLLNRLTDAGVLGRGPALRHPRRHHPPARSCPAARPCCSPTPSASSGSCPTSWSRRSSPRSTS